MKNEMLRGGVQAHAIKKILLGKLRPHSLILILLVSVSASGLLSSNLHVVFLHPSRAPTAEWSGDEKLTCFCQSTPTTNDGMFTTCLPTLQSHNVSNM